MKKPGLLTPLEVAQRLGVKRNRVYAWCRAGTITRYRVGGRYFIPEWAVEKARHGEVPLPDGSPLAKEFLTIQETAAVLGVSDRAVYEWCVNHQIPYRRPGRRYQIPREAVLERMEIIPADPHTDDPERQTSDRFLQGLIESGAVPDPRTIPEGGEDSFDWDTFNKRHPQRSG